MTSGNQLNSSGAGALRRLFAVLLLSLCIGAFAQGAQKSAVDTAAKAVDDAKAELKVLENKLKASSTEKGKCLKSVDKAEKSIKKAEDALSSASKKAAAQAQKLGLAKDDADKAKQKAKLDELNADAKAKSEALDEAKKIATTMKANASKVDADYDKAFKDVQDAKAKLAAAQKTLAEKKAEAKQAEAKLASEAEAKVKAAKEAKAAKEKADKEAAAKALAEKKAAEKAAKDAKAGKEKADKDAAAKALAEKKLADKAAKEAAAKAAAQKKAEEKAAAEKKKAEAKAAKEEAYRLAAKKKAEEKAAKEEAAKIAEQKRLEADPVAKKKAEEKAAKKAAKEAAAQKKAEEKAAAEQKKMEERAVAAEAPVKKTPNVYVVPWKAAQDDEPARMTGGKKINAKAEEVDKNDDSAVCPQFVVAMVSGDKKQIEGMKLWEDWSSYIVFNKVTVKQVRAFHAKLLKAVQDKGYIFAQIVFPTRTWENGIFVAVVDLGKVGDITVKNSKHYSPKQIASALESSDGRFNYADVHNELFGLNARPDLKINTQLQTEKVDGRRIINAELDVKDSLPIHGAVEISNTGSKDSDSDWRIRATLQHLNLTRHGDSLTIDYLTGGDIADNLNAFSGSYFLPINDSNRLNVYAGWSSSTADDVLPELNVRGRGWFAGAAFTHTLYSTELHNVELSLGWFYQKYEQFQDLDGERYEDNDEHVVSMPSLTLGYSSKMFDEFGGRNFASISVKQNRAGQYGSSSSRKFTETSGGKSDGDFKIWTLSLARFQRLFSGEDRPGKWTLFTKASAQIASDGLPTIVRDYVGGMNSVRGYRENELGGDNSFVGSIELRTPLMENFIPGLKKDKEELKKGNNDLTQHRLQLVTFTDMGYVSERHKQGASDEQGFWSVGAGLRMGFTKYAQMSLDYGYPILEASEDTPNDGRLHLSLQLQF